MTGTKRRLARSPWWVACGGAALLAILGLAWCRSRSIAFDPRVEGDALPPSPAFVLPTACQREMGFELARPSVSLPSAGNADRLVQVYQSVTSRPGSWVDLTTLEWESASSGWQRLADSSAPRRGEAFSSTPLRARGEVVARGIGTYPLSEISYPLAGEYAALRGRVAVDDSAPRGASVRFSVFADDALLYRSPVVVPGDAPVPIEVPLVGAWELKLLVDDAGDGPTGDYANWLTPEVFKPGGSMPGSPGLLELAQAQGRTRQGWPNHNEALLRGVVAPAFGSGGSFLGTTGSASLWFDKKDCLLLLQSPRLHIAFGYGGPRHGQFAFSVPSGPSLVGGPSSVLLAPGGRLSLAEARPVPSRPWTIAPVVDPGLGPGAQLTIYLAAPSGDLIVLEIVAFEEGPSLTYRVRPQGLLTPRGYMFLDGDDHAIVGPNPRFLSERGRLWRGRIPDDAVKRRVPLEPSKPLLLWSDATRDGLLLATIDPSEAPLDVSFTRLPGAEGVDLGLGLSLLPVELGRQISPRLWIQFVRVDHVLGAFAHYQAAMSRLYPPAPLPSWVKYQWNTWWTYGPTPTEAGVRRQIDYIARNLADLGPWSVVIDAAWYVANNRPGADVRNVDREKFPGGLRPVTEYAHQRGVKVVLFVPAGFVHSGLRDGGGWLALREIIDEHPDWLIRLPAGDGAAAFMLNYAHPEVRAYLQAIVTDVFDVHGADGIMLDGLADPEGQFGDLLSRDVVGATPPYLPAVDIYRLISNQIGAHRPDAYVESGWVNPLFAHPLAHVFLQSDESPSFDNPYPFGGLLQRTDYALFQWVALGQRPKVGTARGDPNGRDVLRWIEAALGLGVQVTLGFDVAAMEPRQLSALRTRLAHYNAFSGQTVASSRARPNAFATTVGHISYLGVMNRTSRARALGDEIAELGVLAPGLMAFDVERGSWLPSLDLLNVQVGPKSFRLFLIAHQPRIVWSNASWTYESSDDSRLVATLHGPADLAGFAEVWAPGTNSVLLDGVPLERAATPAAGRYAYDARTGVVSLRLSYDRPHRLEVRWG